MKHKTRELERGAKIGIEVDVDTLHKLWLVSLKRRQMPLMPRSACMARGWSFAHRKSLNKDQAICDILKNDASRTRGDSTAKERHTVMHLVMLQGI